MRVRTIVRICVAAAAAAAAGFFVFAWRPAIAPIAPPARSTFDPALVKRGATLAAIGNCVTCHTRKGGAPFAGGRPLETPFGTVITTNITPDPQTGLGQWSRQAFRRALSDGVDRAGQYLYPAFPYDHFTKLTEADVDALYAFVMTRAPIDASTPPTRLRFPFDIRPLLAGWNLLFLDRGRVATEPGRPADWNRGAYLVEALAHCGACHTPRNFLGAEKTDAVFAGGESDGWSAPALDAAALSPVPWTADELFGYLRRGWDPRHGAAAGPMAEVVRNLTGAPDDDLRAMASYVGSFAPPSSAPEKTPALPALTATSDGRAIFAGACAVCHDGTRAPPDGGIDLRLSSAVHAAGPENFVHVVLNGIHPGEGTAGPLMPAFAAALTDTQIAAVADYLRRSIGAAPWADAATASGRLRVPESHPYASGDIR